MDTRRQTELFYMPLTAPFVTLWCNRYLFRRLLVRDIEATFRGSVLGIAWIVFIPLVLVGLYTFVFGMVLGASWPIPTRTPFEVPLIYFAGLSVFGFFIEVISRAPNCLRDNQTYVTKVIFPLEILAWMLVGTALFRASTNFVLLLLFMAVFAGGIPEGTLLVPVLFVPFALLLVGLAWFMIATGAFLRDLAHAVQAFGPMILFLSPVFYALSQVPGTIRPVYAFNPLTFVLEEMRGLLFFADGVSLAHYVLYSLGALAIFAGGHVFFHRLRPGFADVI